MVHLPRVEATLAPLALLSRTVYLPWIKLEQPDARLIRLSEKNNNWTFTRPPMPRPPNGPPLPAGLSARIIFCSIADGSPLMTR